MGEVEVIKLIIQGGFAGFAASLVILLAMVLRHYFQQDKAESNERASWIDLLKTALSTALENQNDRFSELLKESQRYQDTSLEKLLASMTAKMAPIMESRDKQLSLIDANIKVIPAETIRLLVDPLHTAIQQANVEQTEAIKQAFIQAMEPLFAGLNQQIEAMPGVEATRTVVREEITALQNKLIDQIAPIIEQLQSMALALAALTKPINEPNDQAAKESVQLDSHAVDEIIAAAAIPDHNVQIETQEQATNG